MNTPYRALPKMGGATGTSTPAVSSRSKSMTSQPVSTPVPSHGKTKTGPGKSLTKTSHDKSGPGNRPCTEHSFLTDVADMRQMEQGLLQLLDDFNSGKLQAFNQDCTFAKMDAVREQQERLARLHFDLDTQQEIKGLTSEEGRKSANQNMSKLMENLQELCTSIQNLQKKEHPSTTSQ